MSTFSSLTKVFLISAILFCSCTQPKDTVITSDQIDTASVKKEIAGRVDKIIRGCTQLNADTALEPYANTPDFRIASPDGSVTNYKEMYAVQSGFFKSSKYVKFTTTKEDFKFLPGSLVLLTWTGINEFELKTGEHMKIDPYVGSMLFSKTGGVWKIIYAHESAAPAMKVEGK